MPNERVGLKIIIIITILIMVFVEVIDRRSGGAPQQPADGFITCIYFSFISGRRWKGLISDVQSVQHVKVLLVLLLSLLHLFVFLPPLRPHQINLINGMPLCHLRRTKEKQKICKHHSSAVQGEALFLSSEKHLILFLCFSCIFPSISPAQPSRGKTNLAATGRIQLLCGYRHLDSSAAPRTPTITITAPTGPPNVTTKLPETETKKNRVKS